MRSPLRQCFLTPFWWLWMNFWPGPMPCEASSQTVYFFSYDRMGASASHSSDLRNEATILGRCEDVYRSGGAGDRGSETGASRAVQWFESSRWGEFLQRVPVSFIQAKTCLSLMVCLWVWKWACVMIQASTPFARSLMAHSFSHVIRCFWKLWHRSSAFHGAGRCFNTKRGKAERAAEPGA